jgi:molybdenum cofactor guanylyltransferase
MPAAGFVLTGGRSLRMGQDKALLPLQNCTLVEHLARIVATVAHPVSLVGHPERYRNLGLTCLEDQRPDSGPLAGLETALLYSRAELNLLVTCDTPNLHPDWLSSLINQAERSYADCILLRDSEGRSHPLCGIYRNTCLAPLQCALDSGQRRVLSFIDSLTVDWVLIPGVLHNINTPDDWAAWQSAIA